MSNMIHGTVHGRTIELAEDLGLQDGQGVEVHVKAVPPPQPWGEGIRRSAVCMADDPDFEAVMNDIYRDRKLERRPQPEFE
jgi:hypothetical protein